MNHLLLWWYRISLPKTIVAMTPTTPRERERLRYAKLTSGFLLLLFILYIPVGFITAFDAPPPSVSPAIAIAASLLLIIAFILGKLNFQIASAILIVLNAPFIVTANLLAYPLDPSLLPIVYALLFAIILGGALMPPIAAIIIAIFNCIDILAIILIGKPTDAYNAMIAKGLYSVFIFLPILMQIGMGIIIFIIMTNLVQTIHRADRAEEIIALQQEMADFEEVRLQQQEQLEEGIRHIAEVHARVANGDLNARVSLTENNVLWSIAIPLNNLLNRMQITKQTEENLAHLQQAARYIAQQLHEAAINNKPVILHSTSTALDPVIIEINRFIQSRSGV